MNQVTISEPVTIAGVNVFNGRENHAVFYPAEDDTGIVYLVGDTRIPANLSNAFHYKKRGASCIALKTRENSAKAVKVEHMLSALRYGLGIDNLAIELSDGVCPRQNNSVSGIIKALSPLRKQGISEKRYLTVAGCLEDESRVYQGDPDRIEVRQGDGFTIDYTSYFPHKAIGRQRCVLDVTYSGYCKYIMMARGPVFLPFGSRFIIDRLGFMHGVNDDNALLVGSVDDEHFLNKEDCHFCGDEFVRHKILDTFGAIALLEYELKDTMFISKMTGHKFDLEALNKFKERGVFVGYRD
ncbi:MAG: UDP-3-O-acyl-N-acetylglucosamine deacetylase [Nanoarchaeota archaeon]|nr:UDP-3-O-acyl-N-acetylglucosamine deacetylase [Nanoarchaeota archaeon]MBU1704473.1 UDP-3-O-acyl-N-acetylglucosamine deacetylase [Nanoarchaeota archaeon]